MVGEKDYILLSILSYCNFGKKEYGRKIIDIFKDKACQSIIVGTFDILLQKNRKLFLKYFKKELESWSVFYVDNRTAISKNGSVSGFYSVVFIKDSKYVVAYRGSEKFPIEDAYKDFIETDLAIGMGRIPLQFYEGMEVVNTLVNKYSIDVEKISLTGHSLGGGIAQYVAISMDKLMNYIPKVYTWNGVGVNRDGIITVLEFIELKDILRKHTDLTEKEIEYFSSFNDSYLKFLSKELIRIGAIKNDVTVLVKEENQIDFEIDEEFIKRLLKETNIEECLLKFSLQRRRSLLVEQNLFGILFHIDHFVSRLLKAQKYINKVKNNTAYENRVINYGHSEDLTNSLFNHLGTSYLVDRDFITRGVEKSSFFDGFKLFTKSIQDLHFEDVFLAFITGDKIGRELNLDFIASCTRKLLRSEYCLDNSLLASYYLLENIVPLNFERIKRSVILGFQRVGVDILYKDLVVKQIKIMNIDQFKILWEKIKEKLPSPYAKIDIFDIFIFKES